MKTKTLYEIRIWNDSPMMSSRGVGYKGKLLQRQQAGAVVKRLKKMGYEAFKAPYKINAEV